MRDCLLYRILRPIVCFLFKAIYRPNIIGKENIPKTGRIVICGNHTNMMDIPLLFCSTKRTIHFLAKDELFKGLGKPFFYSMGCIPVNRRTKDKKSLASAIKVLEEDKVIGIFPEGTFNKTEDIIMPFKYGAVKMASVTDSYLVPFSITGNYHMFTKKKITICFAKAYKIKGNDIEKANNELMDKVKKLIISNRKEL